MIILEPSLIFGSVLSIGGITVRRIYKNRHLTQLQKELEKHQREEERDKAQQKYQKKRAQQEATADEESRKMMRDNLMQVTELMKKVEHLLENGNEEEALKLLIQITALDKKNRKAGEMLANLYLKHDQNQKAEIIYQNLIERFPHDPVYHSNLAHSYYNRRQFKLAILEYEKALELDKGNPVRYLNIGHVHATKRDLTTAIDYYQKAYRISVRDIGLMFLIIETCLQNQDPITAREYLHKILEFEPYNTRAKELLSEVLQMLK